MVNEVGTTRAARLPHRPGSPCNDPELVAAALSIPLPDVERDSRHLKPKKPRKLTKRERKLAYKLRKDPLYLVREFMPAVWRRKATKDAVQLDWQASEDKQVLRQVQQKVEAQAVQCRCIECRVLARQRKPRLFKCVDLHCAEQRQFDDLLDLIEHQMTEHGRISLGCARVTNALGYRPVYRFDRKVIPPPSVYIFSQYLRPAVRPERWTDIGSVFRERRRLYTGLHHILEELVREFIVGAFEMAAIKVEAIGEVELASQYETALAFYHSSLAHQPGDTHMVDDGSVAVGPGRNWLLSADPENAQFLNQFKYHWGDSSATNDDESEIVLFSAEKADSTADETKQD